MPLCGGKQIPKLYPTMTRDDNDDSINRRRFIQVVGATTGSLAFSSEAVAKQKDEDTVAVPTGKKMPASKVQQAPLSGRGEVSTIDSTEKTHDHGPDDLEWTYNNSGKTESAPADNTYISWARDHYRNWTYHKMTANWRVPDKPRNYDSLEHPVMYYFPGLINCDDYACGTKIIIQPVLQWNQFSEHKGEWSLSSWRVEGGSKADHSPHIRASPGDHIRGIMDYQSNGRWYIKTINKTTGEHTYMYTEDLSNYTFDRAYIALEEVNWDDNSCYQLPGWCCFNDINLRAPDGHIEDPEWGRHTYDGSNCDYGIGTSAHSITITTPHSPC
jgi:hypothetical protein